jgi:hypothetical protein
MKTAGLQLDQAPPLAIPAAFFVMAPAAMVAAGALLTHTGGLALQTAWMPATVALTHLGTLGLLALVMMGALYQMTPVVAGAPVPRIRLAWFVLAGMVVGVGLLAWGVPTNTPWMLQGAGMSLAAAVLLFVLPVGLALFSAPGRNETTWGMKLAVASLCGVVGMGLAMAVGGTLGHPVVSRLPWIQAHLTLGLLGWVGALLAGVSWQVAPMFYLARPVSQGWQRATLALLVAGLGLVVGAHALGAFVELPGHATGELLPVLAAPAAIAVWCVHPLTTLRSLAQRKRKRVDVSLRFWQFGMSAALATLTAGALAWWRPEAVWAVAFGWLAIWGWAGATMHGMLTRIVPFLVWFHRFAPLVGIRDVPPMRRLLPEAHAKAGLGLHALTLVLGLVAIATGFDVLARATGVSLAMTGLVLGATLAKTLRRRP